MSVWAEGRIKWRIIKSDGGGSKFQNRIPGKEIVEKASSGRFRRWQNISKYLLEMFKGNSRCLNILGVITCLEERPLEM